MDFSSSSRFLIHFKYCLTFFPIFFFFHGFSQIEDETNPILESFNEYTNVPREVAYIHLNKSIYIKGETLGFCAYIFDKGTKKLSQLTTNLYCSVTNESGKTIKSKLLLVNDGIAYGSFFVDSLFASGNYTFKAYTNWMKNFDEQNFYIENIRVIDPEIESHVIPKVISTKLDAQFLPEGGHLLKNVNNTIGIIIEDSLGFGVPFVKGQLLNSENKVINTFETNQFGIGKLMIIPKDQEKYRALLDFGGTKQSFDIDLADEKGVIISANKLNEKVILRIATNETTLESLRNKVYKLTIHNGKECRASDVFFYDKLEIVKLINSDDLYSGINVFTLFNENNVPIAERLFFNYDGIKLLETDAATFAKEQDSLVITLPVNDIDINLFNNFSASILPEETKSYSHHNNIISTTFLQPFLKGPIEDAQYYFTDVTRKKEYELDNLLLTQGWSSYDWNTIFSTPSITNYTFESGINFKAHLNEGRMGKFLLYPSSKNNFEVFEITAENTSFEKTGIFPFDDEKIKFSEIQRSNSVKKPKLYLQFSPSKIADFDNYRKPMLLKDNVLFDTGDLLPYIETTWKEYEKLDEVVIEVNKAQERIEKLKNTSYGNVDIFDDKKRGMYRDFAAYISTKGYIVTQNVASFTITDNRPTSFRQMTTTPRIYINNRLLMDLSELSYYELDLVDYIVVNKRGYGAGLMGGSGEIKIFTDYTLGLKNLPEGSSFQEIDIPLTFSSPSKFYVPKYNDYESNFYKKYGVIDWFPIIKADETGAVSFKIQNPKSNHIKIFLEGTANNGSFISEVKVIKIN